MKKVLLICLSFLVVIFFITACSSNNDDGGEKEIRQVGELLGEKVSVQNMNTKLDSLSEYIIYGNVAILPVIEKLLGKSIQVSQKTVERDGFDYRYIFIVVKEFGDRYEYWGNRQCVMRYYVILQNETNPAGSRFGQRWESVKLWTNGGF